MVTLLFIDPAGQRVFKNVIDAYGGATGQIVELEDIAPFLTSIGWPCTLVQETIPTHNSPRKTHGLQFSDHQSLTAFILRWAG